MKFPILWLIFPILSLSACSTLDKKYHEPKPGKLPPATVTAISTHVNDENYAENRILLIDNKPLDPSISGDKIKVEPGTHLFAIGSEFDNGDVSGPFESLTKIYLTTKPGMSYRFVTKVDGPSLAVWAEDANNHHATEVALSPYGYAAGLTNETEFQE